MMTQPPFDPAAKQKYDLTYWIAGVAFLAGLILSILSWLELCVEHCAANQEYLLFNMPFAPIGIAFFAVLLALHLLSKFYPYLGFIASWMVATGLGAEVMFISIQYYQIGHWCPLCLSIAFSLVVAATIYLLNDIKMFLKTIPQSNRGEIMGKIKQLFIPIPLFIFGFLMAFFGVSKLNLAEAAVQDMKEQLAFGQKGSPITVYFITDWFCPSCSVVEPIIESLVPKIHSQVTYYFIDYPIHTKSLNFSPYNLSFLVNNKLHYFEARNALAKLAKVNDSPTDTDVIKMAKKDHIEFKQLSYLDVKTGMEFFDDVVKKYDIDSTPTIIISNSHTKQTRKFEGSNEISEDKILKAIQTLNK